MTVHAVTGHNREIKFYTYMYTCSNTLRVRSLHALSLAIIIWGLDKRLTILNINCRYVRWRKERADYGVVNDTTIQPAYMYTI